MVRQVSLMAALLLLFGVSTAFAKADPVKTQNKMKKAIEVEAKAQGKADDWGLTKDDMVSEIRELTTRLTWLQYQKKKHEIYVKGVEESIADLEARKLEARQLRENLEPYLEEVVDRLEAFIPTDLPFFLDERQQRLSFLKSTLNDYNLDLGEKLRRVYEALTVEATYGKMVTSSDETLSIDGVDTEVTVFRLGRMAMFFQTLDEEKIGLWNKKTGQWEPMSDNYGVTIRHGLEMARRERSVQLILLPLGAQE